MKRARINGALDRVNRPVRNFQGHALAFAGAALLIITAVRASGQAPAPDFAERVAQTNISAVVVISGVKGDELAPVQCSGCVVDRRGIILTTAHQMEGLKDIKGKLPDGTVFSLSALAVDNAMDASLLQADRPLPLAARLGDADTLRVGAPLVSLSTPLNLEFSLVRGVVSSLRRTYRGVPVMQAELNASPGSSGGPVFDVDGLLVGMLLGKLNDQPWLSVVLPVNQLVPLLKAHGVLPGPAAPDTVDELVPVPNLPQNEAWALEAYNMGVRTVSDEEKARHYRRAAELLPAFYEAWFNLAVSLTALGRTGDALAAYDQARQIHPNAPEPLRNMGLLYLKNGTPEKALNCFDRVLGLDGGAARSYNERGVALQRLNRHRDAVAAFGDALRLEPENSRFSYNLGLSLAALGEAQSARDALRRYLEAEPGAPDAPEVARMIESLSSPDKDAPVERK